jgi:hypothetical protein
MLSAMIFACLKLLTLTSHALTYQALASRAVIFYDFVALQAFTSLPVPFKPSHHLSSRSSCRVHCVQAEREAMALQAAAKRTELVKTSAVAAATAAAAAAATEAAAAAAAAAATEAATGGDEAETATACHASAAASSAPRNALDASAAAGATTSAVHSAAALLPTALLDVTGGGGGGSSDADDDKPLLIRRGASNPVPIPSKDDFMPLLEAFYLHDPSRTLKVPVFCHKELDLHQVFAQAGSHVSPGARPSPGTCLTSCRALLALVSTSTPAYPSDLLPVHAAPRVSCTLGTFIPQKSYREPLTLHPKPQT